MNEAKKKHKELIRKIMGMFQYMSVQELSVVYAFVSQYSGAKEEQK